MRSPNQRRSWIIPALFALVLFVGSITANVITAGMDEFAKSYRPWLWGFTLFTGLAAVAAAIWDWQQAQIAGEPQPL